MENLGFKQETSLMLLLIFEENLSCPILPLQLGDGLIKLLQNLLLTQC